MNTIRRTIRKEDDRKNKFELSFEGEKGKFEMWLEQFNPYSGTQRVKISLDPEDAKVLKTALDRFLL